MPSGGRLWIKLLHDAENDMIDLVVRDNGCGIPADKLPRIFESFYTTKSGPDASGKGGTGLGLSMCRDIIEAHHGRIRVDSTPGKGTAFTLKLPAAAKPAPKRPPRDAADYDAQQCCGTINGRQPAVGCVQARYPTGQPAARAGRSGSTGRRSCTAPSRRRGPAESSLG